jgi:hypothetical protein
MCVLRHRQRLIGKVSPGPVSPARCRAIASIQAYPWNGSWHWRLGASRLGVISPFGVRTDLILEVGPGWRLHVPSTVWCICQFRNCHNRGPSPSRAHTTITDMTVTRNRTICRTILILLSTVSAIAGAQSPVSLQDVATLVQQAVLQQRFAESREHDYVFRQDTNDIRLAKECTWAPKCPARFGTPGVKGVAFRVLDYTEHHFEIFWLDGVRVARVLPSCGHCGRGAGPAEAYIMNVPISAGELASENERVDKEVGEAEELRAQGKDPNSPDDPPQILLSRMLELCRFSNPRREMIGDRPTILLDFAWNPSVEPVSPKEAILKSFAGTVGIDEEDHAVQHVEGRFLADVRLDGGSIKIRKGTRVTIINRRVDTGIWLLSRLDARGEADYYAFAIDGDGHIFTGDYRKFRSTVKILPGYSEVPADSPALSNPKPLPNPNAPH